MGLSTRGGERQCWSAAGRPAEAIAPAFKARGDPRSLIAVRRILKGADE
jgi:hypothetical protein